jgi:CheY-like chemotaxis protein
MDYSWKNYTVLVAEDDPLNYRYIELLLSRRTGINLIWAKDGRQAANACQQNSGIDIVLLDLQLPEIDGLKTLELIKKYNPYLPVIIQTANSWNNEEDTCYQAGSDGFFNKPLNIDNLLLRMEQCLKVYASIRPAQLKS